MQFQPIDEKAYSMRNVWPKGWYSATVATSDDAVTEGVSQNGNPFFKAQIDVYDVSGAFKRITAYIMAGGKAEWQLRSAAEAFGVLEQYKSGILTADDLKGRSGYVKLGVEEDESGQYAPKNKISDYKATPPKGMQQPTQPAPSSEKKSDEPIDDSIPF